MQLGQILVQLIFIQVHFPSWDKKYYLNSMLLGGCNILSQTCKNQYALKFYLFAFTSNQPFHSYRFCTLILLQSLPIHLYQPPLSLSLPLSVVSCPAQNGLLTGLSIFYFILFQFIFLRPARVISLQHKSYVVPLLNVLHWLLFISKTFQKKGNRDGRGKLIKAPLWST